MPGSFYQVLKEPDFCKQTLLDNGKAVDTRNSFYEANIIPRPKLEKRKRDENCSLVDRSAKLTEFKYRYKNS